MLGLLTKLIIKDKLVVSRVSSDEGLTLKTSALQSLYGGQFTFSCQLC